MRCYWRTPSFQVPSLAFHKNMQSIFEILVHVCYYGFENSQRMKLSATIEISLLYVVEEPLSS